MFYHNDSSIQIYTDGANLDDIQRLAKDDLIDGITTNPTLMHKAGVTNYMEFARAASRFSRNKPLSLEVFNDNISDMIAEGIILSKISDNVNIKVPITNSVGDSTQDAIIHLLRLGIKVNITAVLTYQQIDACINMIQLVDSPQAIISIFSGRIADTGIDPLSHIDYAVSAFRNYNNIQVLWASTREVFNVYQAMNVDCDIITCSPSIINKLALSNYDLSLLSLETVQILREIRIKRVIR